MERYDRRLTVVSETMVWQRDADGFWERHLLRRLKNGSLYWSPLTHVLADVPCCLVCLSHRVAIHGSVHDDNTLTCHDCGARYWFL